MIRLVVLVSGRGTNLDSIFRACDEGRCRAQVVAVVSDRARAAALDLARGRDLPAEVVPLRRGDDREAWNQKLADTVAAHDPALVVLAGFMRLVGTPFLRRFPGHIINVHPSLLPAFPGADGPAQAVAAGVRISGCTVHVVDDGVDTGTILAQGAVPVLPDDDASSLHKRIQQVEHRLLPEVIDWVAGGAVSLGPAPRIEAPVDAGAEPLLAPRLRSGGDGA